MYQHTLRQGLRHRIALRLLSSMALCALHGGLCFIAYRADAQDNKEPKAEQKKEVPPAPVLPPFASPKINFRERPKFPIESQRLRRTVQIDGTISDNEWDPFFTVTDGPIRGTVYLNWDEDFLYLATRTDTPSCVVFNIDASGDGWLRGADNLEVVIENTVASNTPIISVRLLDAANSKDTPVWNEQAYDPKKIKMASRIVNGAQYLEIAIPKEMGSLQLRDGATPQVRADFFAPSPNPFKPTEPFEPHLLLETTLVASRAQAVAGINPQLTLSDEKCVAGQELSATLRLLNQTDVPVVIKSVTWAGQGNSVNALNTLRQVAIAPIPSLKKTEVKYKTTLPPTLSPGTYTLGVTAELEGGKQVIATRTFSVVEPLQVSLTGEPQPVAIIGSTKYTLLLDVFSAVPVHVKAEAEITQFPQNWTLDGNTKKKRGVEVDGEDKRKIARFPIRLPSTTPAGDYPVEMTVTLGKRTWVVRHVVRVIRTDAPKPETPKADAPKPDAPSQK